MCNKEDSRNFWNAGDLGCGELIIILRKRMKALEPDEQFEVIAEDPGAHEDLPAWGRMTGNTLILAKHPSYIFKKKKKGN